MTTNLIGSRIKALREERGLSQDDLARMFGFKDRQTSPPSRPGNVV